MVKAQYRVILRRIKSMEIETKQIKRGWGQPSKLTPDRLEKILEALREGNYRDSAAEAAGISYQTFRNWEKRGEAEKSGRFWTFLEAIRKAEAEGELHNLKIITNAAEDGDWRAAAWQLERKNPAKWGRKDAKKVEMSGELKSGVDFVLIKNAILATLAPYPEARIALSEKLDEIDEGGDDTAE